MSGPVSLILPNKNNAPVLDRFFKTLRRNTTYADIELIVVDDGSTDSSPRILRRWRDSGAFPHFDLVETSGGGIVNALNLAAGRARGEVIVRLDGDSTIETRGWLERMLAFRRLSPKVGVIAGAVMFDSGRVHSYGMNVVSPAGIHSRGTRLEEQPGSRTLDIAVHYPRVEDAEGGEAPAEVDGVIGCCMLFERALWRRVGGFDARYNPAGFEDFDFALMARREGRKVFVLPEVSIVHRVSMRNPRDETSRRVMLLFRLRRGIGGLVPERLRDAAAARVGLGDYDPARLALLRRHYSYWHEKWGFDPLNPDMEAVLARWGGTEVCWAYDEAMRREGQEILRSWRRQCPRPAAAERSAPT
jgi:GT2 family glycosyltransferase